MAGVDWGGVVAGRLNTLVVSEDQELSATWPTRSSERPTFATLRDARRLLQCDGGRIGFLVLDGRANGADARQLSRLLRLAGTGSSLRTGILAVSKPDARLLVEAHERRLLVVDHGQISAVVAILASRAVAAPTPAPPELFVSLDGTVHGLDQEVILATGECLLISYLVAMRGSWRSARAILRDVFQRQDAGGTALVWKYVSGLRKKLRSAGAVIESSPKRGYRLASGLRVVLEGAGQDLASTSHAAAR
ncbi:MAG: hypothetical protein K0R38_586 [Polyangiaceae bacterium]|jgi:DNA-binding winged helix-turn-helix (wHTH) protein|nr:hypothetical protein [Polyangiaceae bacterium]